MTLTKKILKVFFPIVAVLILCFIFGNSFKIKKEVQKKKDTVNEIVVEVVNTVSKKKVTTSDVNAYVAKAGHIFEFLCFAFFAGLSYRANFHKLKPYFFQIMFIGLLCAVIDEFIQSFSQGRESTQRDILIDLIGITAGVLLSLLADRIYRNKFLPYIKSKQKK